MGLKLKTMITEQLKELVREEARNLREKATKEELGRLDFDTLNPMSERRCIYGQVTGSCISKRAVELIQNCCNKVVSANGKGSDVSDAALDFEGLNLFNSRFSYWSPIELYIGRDGAKNANLIAYLKGEIDTLEL